MSLDKYEAIPVDTHIWQVTIKDYLPHLKNAKTLTPKIYKEIGKEKLIIIIILKFSTSS